MARMKHVEDEYFLMSVGNNLTLRKSLKVGVGYRSWVKKFFWVNAFGSNEFQQVEQKVYEASSQSLSGKTVVHLVGMNTIYSPLLSPRNVHAVNGHIVT